MSRLERVLIAVAAIVIIAFGIGYLVHQHDQAQRCDNWRADEFTYQQFGTEDPGPAPSGCS